MASIEKRSCLSLSIIFLFTVSCTGQDCQRQDVAIANDRRYCRPSCTINGNECNAPEQCVCDGICGLTCVPIGLGNYCEPVPARDHVISNYSPDNMSFGTLVTSSCESGYERISGNKYRVCGGDGRWGGEELVCEILLPCNAELRPVIDNARVQNLREISQYQPGERMSYRCKHGIQPVGLDYITCLYDGTWSEPELNCIVPCDAEVWPTVDNAIVLNLRDQYQPNEKMLFGCTRGYYPVGLDYITCLYNGTWTQLDPDLKCIASPICEDGLNPGTISNGHVFMTEEPADNQRFRFGTVLGYVCYDGFTLDGEQTTRKCLESGEWTAAKPKCINNDDTPGEQLENDWNVYFIFDSSNSVGLDFFKKGIYFAKKLVSKVGVGSIGSSGARYGAMLLASTPTNLFHLSDPFNTVGAVTVALEQAANFAEKAELLGHNGTDMYRALVHVEKEMLRSTPARTNATSVLFLITDGQSTGGNNLDEIANRLKTKYNFSIYCIGVGSEINRIASTPLNEHVFSFSGYLYMDQVVDAVTKAGKEFECGIGRGPFTGNLRGRIVGGNNAGYEAWPWMVGLYHWPNKDASPEFFCGGSLIGSNWILTAAQCFDSNGFLPEKLPEDIIVAAGSNEKIRNLDDILMPTRGLQILQVAEIIKHEQFDLTFDYDIALIRLQTKAVLTRTVNPVCLPDPGLEANNDLLTTGVNNQPLPYIIGWGRTNEFSRQSLTLQHVAIPLKGRLTCANSLSQFPDYLFTKRMMCAGYTMGERSETGEIISVPRDACSGDSGGPLVRARRINGEDIYFQIGIVSWGIGCARPGQYGFYTRVPLLVDWVNAKTA